MTTISSPVNTAAQSTDSVVLGTSTAGVLKRAVAGSSQSVTSGDTNAAAQEVGTNVDDAAFGVATGTVVMIAGLADETSPDSVNEGDAGAIRMTLARNLHTVEVADVAAVTSVASTASSTTILAANANRIGAMVHNTDANALFLKFGATATATTSFTVKIPADGYYEFPHPVYRGIVDGIWASNGAGDAVVTELT